MTTAILDIVLAGIVIGGIYSLVAIGLNLQWGVTRVLNVSHGEFIMFGAFGAYFLYTLFGISPLISLVIVGPIMFGLAVVYHRVLFLHLLKSAQTMAAYEVNSLLVAYGLMFIMQNGASLAWGGTLKGYTYLANSIEIAGSLLAVNRLIVFIFAICFCIGIYFFLNRTRMGKAIRATSLDIDTAQLMGVNVYALLAVAFGLGAMLAALAGALISMLFPTTPFMGTPYLVITFIVVILGGMGNMLGSLIGGFILGFIGSIVTYIEPGFSMVAFYIIFLIIILAKPTGILGKQAA